VSTGARYGPSPSAELQRQDVAALLQHTYQWTRAASTVVPPVAQQVAPAVARIPGAVTGRRLAPPADALARARPDRHRCGGQGREG